MTIKPIKDRVLVVQTPVKEKLSNGLYLPQGSRELYEDIGVVLAVGPDVKEVAVGDKVMFTRRPESELPEKDHLMLREENIVGIIED